MKKSFTLVEMLVSITLFSIVLIFLYQALDMTKLSNKFYSDKLSNMKAKSDIKKLLFIDMLNKTDNNISIIQDKNENTVFKFKTTNIYHNAFYTNITYLVSKQNNLIRCESKDKFDKNKIYKFVDSSYIDIVENNITKFKISPNKTNKNSYILYIKYKDNSDIYITL